MDTKDMNPEAQQAIASVHMADLKKQINAASWNENMENLMKSWGEKAAGLRFMHDNAAGSWKKFSNTLTLWSIAITTIASGTSLVATSIDDEQAKNAVLYTVGGIGIISTLIQSLKKFYNAEEKSADHNSIARQFGSFYRYMVLQMNLTREDREPSDKLSEYALKEYERLQQEAPTLGGAQVQLFRSTFKNSKQAIPDICEKEFNINVYKPTSLKLDEDNVTIIKNDDLDLKKLEVKVDSESNASNSSNNVILNH